VITIIDKNVPTIVKHTVLINERLKTGLDNIFWYAAKLKPFGHIPTCKDATAILSLTDTLNICNNGKITTHMTKIITNILITQNIFSPKLLFIIFMSLLHSP